MKDATSCSVSKKLFSLFFLLWYGHMGTNVSSIGSPIDRSMRTQQGVISLGGKLLSWEGIGMSRLMPSNLSHTMQHCSIIHKTSSTSSWLANWWPTITAAWNMGGRSGLRKIPITQQDACKILMENHWRALFFFPKLHLVRLAKLFLSTAIERDNLFTTK